MTIRPFTHVLRKNGFELDFRSRSGGTTVTQFKKRSGNRELHVQLWADGNHRVSHGTYSKINGRDCLHETTRPTDFKTVAKMKAALVFEWNRSSTKVKAR